MCRKLVADLLNDSLLIGKASGRRAEVTEMMKHLEPGD
jgi:hypothetical protein